MVSSTYSSGSWMGIVRSGSVIVLEGHTDPNIVAELWDFLGQEPTVHGVLNEITEAFGTGLTNLPPFAIVVRSDRLHVILRGDMDLVASSEEGTDTVSGRDVTTWSERSLPLPHAFTLTLAQDDGFADDGYGFSLPVHEAVVRLQELTVEDALDGGAGQEFLVMADDAGDSSASGYADFAAPDSDEPDFDGPDFEAEELGDQEPTAAGYDDGMALLTPVEAAPELAAYGDTEEFTGGFMAGNGAGHLEAGHQDAELADAAHADLEHGEDAAFVDDDAYAEFAMAAEAADAEWNAQLAPVARLDPVLADELAAEPMDDGIGLDGPEDDLNLTILPYRDEETSGDHDGYVAEDHDEAAHDEDAPDEDAQADAVPQDGTEADAIEEAHHDGGTGPDPEAGTDLGTGEAAPSAGDAVDDGFTINYDFLFGATVAKSVEAAAVRVDTDGDAPGHTPGETVMPPMPTAPPLAGSQNAGSADDQKADSHNQGAEDNGPDAAGEDAGAQESGAPEFDAPEPDDAAVMIDSVPWASQEPAPATPAALPPVGSPQDSTAAGAAAGMAPAMEAPRNAAYDPDHDGHTVMRSGLGHDAGHAEAAPLESRPPTGPMVLARMCPNGHANPPSRATCWSCAQSINAEPREVGRPRLGIMHISSGEVVELDHSLIIGRQPSVSRVMGGAMPRLVQVKSGNGDISRSHVEVRLDGWDVLLVDLKATNGTVLVREGQAPRRLSQGEEAILLNGDIAELGDGVSLLFDGLL